MKILTTLSIASFSGSGGSVSSVQFGATDAFGVKVVKHVRCPSEGPLQRPSSILVRIAIIGIIVPLLGE